MVGGFFMLMRQQWTFFALPHRMDGAWLWLPQSIEGGTVLIPKNQTSAASGTCDDANGMLPQCAPLAVPYVPFQQNNPQRYPQQQALANGTLFPGLNLPFRVKDEAKQALGGPLAELQALEFMLLELALYLDTHSDDQEAFALYQQYVDMERQARASYEAVHGPLTQTATAKSENWSAWLNGTWPWTQMEGGNR